MKATAKQDVAAVANRDQAVGHVEFNIILSNV